MLVFLSHQTQSKKSNTIIISIQDHYPSIRIEFLSRFGLIKLEGEIGHKTREIEKDQRKGKPKNQRGEEQETIKEREDRGFIHQDPTKTTQNSSLTKNPLLINLCFTKNQCFPGRSHNKTKVS